MNPFLSRTTLFMSIVLVCPFAIADVTVPNIFSNSMVLQRDQPNAVWGKADPGEAVTVGIGSQKHAATAGDLEINKAYDRQDITFGCDFKISPGVALKADYQWRTDALEGDNRDNLFNAGIGVMF